MIDSVTGREMNNGKRRGRRERPNREKQKRDPHGQVAKWCHCGQRISMHRKVCWEHSK